MFRPGHLCIDTGWWCQFGKFYCAIFVMSTFIHFPLCAAGTNDQNDVNRADELFTAGKFSKVEDIYASIVERDANNSDATFSWRPFHCGLGDGT